MTSVYFARGLETGLIKIGFSERPHDRLKNVAYEYGERCELIFALNGAYLEEQKFHALFRKYRYRGKGRGVEWFREEGTLADFIRKKYDYMTTFYQMAAWPGWQENVLDRLCQHPKLTLADCSEILGGKPFTVAALASHYKRKK